MYKLYIEKDINTGEVLKKYDIDYYYDESGKLRVKNNSFYISISHSDNITALAIADKEVGVDIEKITYRERVINHMCNHKEKKLIKTDMDFTIMWTKKESYVKYLGQGISYGLKNVDTTNLNFATKTFDDYIVSIYMEGL